MNPQKFPDLSIDIETLGLTPDAIIIQIGIVEFNTDTKTIGDGLVLYPDLKEQSAAGRIINFDTLKWWVQTNGSLLGNILSQKTDKRSEVLERIIDAMVPCRSYWFKHPLFDMSILNNAYGLEQELRALNPRAYRKIKDVATLAPALNVPEPAFVGAQHDALVDAAHQAEWVIECFAKMQGGE